MNIVKPASEKQALFLQSKSDITILSGAGVGKTYGNLLIHLEASHDPLYSGLFAKGSARATSFAFDEAAELYKDYGIKVSSKDRKIIFDTGAQVAFRSGLSMEEVGRYANGGQFDKATIDDASLFDLAPLFYIFSRIRGRSSVSKQAYLTCNADKESEVKQLVTPWLDSDGYPNGSRSGREFYMYRDQELGIVYTSKPVIEYQHSVTYIHDKVTNNPYLANTKYVDYLMNCGEATQSLFYGKW